MRAGSVLVVVSILYLLHFDFWLWNRPEIVLGLPLELWYQLGYCLLVSAVLALILRRGWKAGQESGTSGPSGL